MAWLDNLVEHWRLDEVSGSRTGRHAGIALTDNNTVTQAAGKIGNAAQFTAANSESLTAADSAALSTGNISFTWAMWVYFDTLTGEQWLVGKRTTDTDREYVIRINAAGASKLEVALASGGTNYNLVATTFGNLSTATWYLAVLHYDAVADVLSVGVNNVFNSLGSVGGPSDTTGILSLGAQNGFSNFLNGRLDSISFWKRALTTDELTALYNGGSGLNYPFGQAAAGALTPAGAVARQAAKALAGVFASAGALTRAVRKALAGALTPSAVVARRISRALTGAITSAGTLARRTLRPMAGDFTPTGALTRAIGKPLAGALSSAATVTRMASHALAGALTPAGSLARLTARALDGALGAAGALARLTARALAGALGLQGALENDAPARGLVALTLLRRLFALVLPDRSPALQLAERAVSLELPARSPALTLPVRSFSLTLPEL